VLEIVREIHGGHAACAELARDAVAIRESDAELLEGVGHESGLIVPRGGAIKTCLRDFGFEGVQAGFSGRRLFGMPPAKN